MLNPYHFAVYNSSSSSIQWSQYESAAESLLLLPSRCFRILGQEHCWIYRRDSQLRSAKKGTQRKTGVGSVRIDEPPPTQEEEKNREFLIGEFSDLSISLYKTKLAILKMRIDSEKFTIINNEVENLH